MKRSAGYYTPHSPFTDPGSCAHLYEDLPEKPEDLIPLIQGLLVHRNAAAHFHLQWTRVQRAELRLRTVEQRLARIHELDPSPLTDARPPAQRQVALCRDFAVLMTSMLRHLGIPSRMRVGFADYLALDSPLKADHWITEYWHSGQERWILIDADIGGMPAGSLPIKGDCNLLDIRPDKDFYVAGSAWKLARTGQIQSTFFRYSGRWKGFPCIRGNMLHDFQSLNRMELGIFDYFDELSYKPERSINAEDRRLLDQIAELTSSPDDQFCELRALFDSLPRTHTIRSKLRLLGVLGAPGSSLAPVELHSAGLSRLVPLTLEQQPPGSDRLPEPSSEERGLRRFGDGGQPQLPEGHPSHKPEGDDTPWHGISVRGARQHNLRGIDLDIPANKLVVLTGVSGSGKSSLAFDTIYAEGQRRYVESLSSYARQFLGRMEKAQLDQITGLSPTVAIEQKGISRNLRSTVGTVTDVLDYLRVLYARIGLPHCPQCGGSVEPQPAAQIVDQLSRLPQGTPLTLLAPLVRGRKGGHRDLLERALAQGHSEAQVDGVTLRLDETLPVLDGRKRHNIELVVDRLIIPPNGDTRFRSRLADSVDRALKLGGGLLLVAAGKEQLLLSQENACLLCDLSFPKLEPGLFSFNSPFGMCGECNGMGIKLQVDPDLIINQPHLSLLDGASAWHGPLKKKLNGWHGRTVKELADVYQADLELPWLELPESFRRALLYGSGDKKIRFQYQSGDGMWQAEGYRDTKGVIYHINRLFRQTKSEERRRYFTQFMSKQPCPACQGERLCREARYVTVNGRRLPEITGWSIGALHDWIGRLPQLLTGRQRQIGGELLAEIRERLGFIRAVGLHYLTLDRPAPTLSGGEGQRIRLASQIGSGLVGVLYILDEPSIGLHPRDQGALLRTLLRLRDLRNTVLVVEHDADTMLASDWLIDLGPGAGIKGGRLVSAGTPETVMADAGSLTGRYLKGELQVRTPDRVGVEPAARRQGNGWLALKGAALHNLKQIDAQFPLGAFSCVTGVSGSGKSSLIGQTLQPLLARLLHHAQTVPGPFREIIGLDQLNKVINITQEPIGRNPRSNPGTYSGALAEIRKLMAATPAAQEAGYGPGRFSFNLKGGRCEACAGHGSQKVEMQFLADVWVRCQTCQGQRFNRETLKIELQGQTIAGILDMEIEQAATLFQGNPALDRVLGRLVEVGLGYLKLGQSALTLSGGEAQRVKLAKELSRVATGRTLYILDEPTTGLHFADIQKLVDLLHKLVDAGNSVIVIEHNLDVIKTADWIIDLGPEGGEEGGHIVAQGTPEQVAETGASFTGRLLRHRLQNRPAR